MVDTTAYPYRTIARITLSIGGVSGYQGSGVLISPDEVLTAAHVAYTTGVGVSTDIQVSPGYSAGAAPFGTYSGYVTHYQPINDSFDLISASDSQIDYAIIHLTTPTTVGYMGLTANYPGGSPTVSGYPATSGGQQVDVVEAMTKNPTYTWLSGTSIGSGSSGGPVWAGDANGATVLGTVSAGTSTGQGRFTAMTSSEQATLLSWMAQDDGYSPTVGYIDPTSGKQGYAALSPVAAGGPSTLDWQYIWASPDGVSMIANAPNTFLHGGSGSDALVATAGQNVLDGGPGSNFLTGGPGNDTFFTDARPSSTVWSTLLNFHAGDAATLWGYVPGVSSYSWDPGLSGAQGATGATLRANIVGGAGQTGNGVDASITFAGMSVAQAKALQITVGGSGSSAFLYFYNPGV